VALKPGKNREQSVALYSTPTTTTSTTITDDINYKRTKKRASISTPTTPTPPIQTTSTTESSKNKRIKQTPVSTPTPTPAPTPTSIISLKRKSVIDEHPDDLDLWNVLWPTMVGLGWTSRYPKSSKVNVDRVYFMPDVVRMTAVEGTHKFSGYEHLIAWIREHRPKDVAEAYENI
jgi:hypothetical protein